MHETLRDARNCSTFLQDNTDARQDVIWLNKLIRSGHPSSLKYGTQYCVKTYQNHIYGDSQVRKDLIEKYVR